MKPTSLKLLTLSLTTLLVLSACASRLPLLSSSPTEIYYKDGRTAYVANCVAANWGACLEKAGVICRDAGYTILEKNSSRSYGEDEKELVFSCNGKPASTEK